MSNENGTEINRHGMRVPMATLSTEARVPSPPLFKVGDGNKSQHAKNSGQHLQGGYPIQVVLQQKAENPGTPQAPKVKSISHGSLVVQPPSLPSPKDIPKTSPQSAPQLQDLKGRSRLDSGTSFAVNDTDLHRRSFASASSSFGERTYKYKPIEDTSIRLVRLLPERKTMVKCEIIHASLGQPPPYVAVSYTWGDTGDTRKIEIEGMAIPVAVSLHGALQALRQKQNSLLVWVDALCINQKNRDERSQQVQLMPNIYSNAESVAIWLGPEENDSTKAVHFIEQMSAPISQIGSTSQLLSSGTANGDLLAVVSLFGRDYWRRLWVVQKVFNARSIAVYCGQTQLAWASYQYASATFSQRRGELIFTNQDPDNRRLAISPDQFSYVQTLIYQGPANLPDLRSYVSDREMVLLEVLRACRRKLASDPRDKIYGILGVLPASIRDEFRADYNLSVKDVYTEVVDFLLKTTERLDIISEAIHFPVHTNSNILPSFVPDWSHIPQTSAMGFKYGFSAAGSSKAVCRFCDDRLNKLEISAIEVDVIRSKGVAVGTLCNLGDYLMAFLHWSALLLQAIGNATKQDRKLAEERFAATLCLGQIPSPYDRSRWLTLCYHIFACLFRDRLPYLPLDLKLRDHLDIQSDIKPEMRRHFLQTNFGDRMMGRCFCLTQNSRMGMGSGFMLAGDIVVVPLGCSTPILLRAEGTQGEYRFVGDIYIDGYMYGRAVEQ
ncbi:hypothetical protein FSARC_4600 [Fusarium sarcochroum]|uniref:Heterokaryon incompatibility domain-containing protein n=1 Tax=Fusarium sarcochroum TaxID=1208366 RepID=A0A8H4U1D1_9HYPO|nr:hypothetical protein FSARC_4600 [Fusarium sarcochroum]